MENDSNSTGSGNVPFPLAGKSKALREEDAFMEMHGGWGSCAIYTVVCWLESIAHLPRFLLQAYQTARLRTAESKAALRQRRQSLP